MMMTMAEKAAKEILAERYSVSGKSGYSAFSRWRKAAAARRVDGSFHLLSFEDGSTLAVEEPAEDLYPLRWSIGAEKPAAGPRFRIFAGGAIEVDGRRGLHCRQGGEGTLAWDATGRVLELPKKRYALSSHQGCDDFFRDLEKALKNR